MIQEGQGKDIDGIIKRVANLLAVSLFYGESPTLVDRFANALSKEAVAKVLYDVERIVQMGRQRGEINEISKNISGKDLPAISVTSRMGEYQVIGYLPTTQDIEDFLGLIERDVYYSRKAGALAMSIAIENKMEPNKRGEEQ